VLRRHLPSTVQVGRGFVVAPGVVSRQIDVLIYDATKPVLFQDGDLVTLASDAVRAIIEVKSKIDSYQNLAKIAEKLADHAEFLFEQTPGNQFITNPPFIGLFAYDWIDGSADRVLSALNEAAIKGGARNPLHALSITSLWVHHVSPDTGNPARPRIGGPTIAVGTHIICKRWPSASLFTIWLIRSAGIQ
jgi:hypothetical protein